MTVKTFCRTLLIALAPVMLAGCSSITELFSDPLTPQKGVVVLDLTGTGYQQFQCTADKKGRYWRFVSPKVELKDKSGKVVATQGSDFTFTAPDGSVLTGKIVRWDEKTSPLNVRSVLFETHGHGKTGVLTGIGWVKRIEGKGGIPQTRCSASQLGSFLQVPFTARYVFYR